MIINIHLNPKTQEERDQKDSKNKCLLIWKKKEFLDIA